MIDWAAVVLSVELALATLAVLIPLALLTARRLAQMRSRAKPVIAATAFAAVCCTAGCASGLASACPPAAS